MQYLHGAIDIKVKGSTNEKVYSFCEYIFSIRTKHICHFDPYIETHDGKCDFGLTIQKYSDRRFKINYKFFN